MNKEQLETYLASKEFSWAPTTRRSIGYALGKVLPFVTGDPAALWREIANLAPHSRVTVWRWASSLWDYFYPNENPYRDFKRQNPRLFRNTYVKRPAEESGKEAMQKINDISDPAIRKKAIELLETGMRYSESFTYKDGEIIGKGGKVRRVYLRKVEGPEYTGSYRSFLRALKYVGLKPHTLRKIYLTEIMNNGASIFELKAVAGWSDIKTAESYIGVPNQRLKELSYRVRKSINDKRPYRRNP